MRGSSSVDAPSHPSHSLADTTPTRPLCVWGGGSHRVQHSKLSHWCCPPNLITYSAALPLPPAADRLEALRARCTAWLLPYTAGYVWNKDPLTLRSSARQQPPWERAAAQRRRRRQGQGQQAPGAGAGAAGSGEQGRQQAEEGCLWAVMRFGDAVDDEWWAVWLLLRMSRELQDLTVQVGAGVLSGTTYACVHPCGVQDARAECVCVGGLTLNQSRKETVALQGETAAAYASCGTSP